MPLPRCVMIDHADSAERRCQEAADARASRTLLPGLAAAAAVSEAGFLDIVRSRHAGTAPLKDGDRVEVVHAIGGS